LRFGVTNVETLASESNTGFAMSAAWSILVEQNGQSEASANTGGSLIGGLTADQNIILLLTV
jgi:hypothetical protein